jgi:hypothetical protein
MAMIYESIPTYASDTLVHGTSGGTNGLQGVRAGMAPTFIRPALAVAKGGLTCYVAVFYFIFISFSPMFLKVCSAELPTDFVKTRNM